MNTLTAKTRWAQLATVINPDDPIQPAPKAEPTEPDPVPVSKKNFLQKLGIGKQKTGETKTKTTKLSPFVQRLLSRKSKKDDSTVEEKTDSPNAGLSRIRQRMNAMRFLHRIKGGKNDKKHTHGEGFDADDFAPEATRRFLFDDTALQKGATMKELFSKNEPPEEDFNDIVDQDDRRVETFVSQELVGVLIESVHFRIFIFGLIVINSVLIGLQTSEHLSQEYRYYFSIFDQAVLAIFIFEIIIKWYHGFWIFWKVGWNILDFVVIAILILGPQVSFLGTGRILRILRVLRAFRSLKSISALAGLSTVVQTILQSVPDMTNICLLLTIILLMLGVAGVTLFGRLVPDRFGDLQTAMFSLFICCTQDGWVNIYNTFRDAGGWLHLAGAIYFSLAILLGAFVFANLIVAVVVTNLEMAMKELKEEKKREVDTLATKPGTEYREDRDTGEAAERVPLVVFSDVQKGVDFPLQTPLELNNMKGLTLDKLEKYYLVVIAIEENLAEYASIMQDLQEMYEVVRTLNTLEPVEDPLDDDDEPYDPDFATDIPLNQPQKYAGSSINLSSLKKGDILSNLMKLEEMDTITSHNAQSIGEVLRSTRLPTKPRPSSTRLGTRTRPDAAQAPTDT